MNFFIRNFYPLKSRDLEFYRNLHTVKTVRIRDTLLQYGNNENTGNKFKMTQKKLTYPFQYRDELAPEMAGKNRKSVHISSVLTYSTPSLL